MKITTRLLNEMPLKAFQKMEYFNMGDDDWFNIVVIVPVDEIHESDFRCMKFVLYNSKENKIVGVVGGYSDVIHPNGIMKPMNVSLDCLKESHLIRIMTREKCKMEELIGFGSDFEFYGIDRLDRYD